MKKKITLLILFSLLFGILIGVSASGSFRVEVRNSLSEYSGKGSYYAGEKVTVRAGSRPGLSFTGWTSDSFDVVFASPKSSTTTFIMPSESVIVTASWKDNPATAITVDPPDITIVEGNVLKQTRFYLAKSQTQTTASVIYYSLDGFTPTTLSKRYDENPIILTHDMKIRAIEVYRGIESQVASKDVTVELNSVKFSEAASGTRYIKPRSNTTFAPNSKITRYETFESLYRLIQFDQKGDLGTELKDVKEDMKQIVAYFQSADVIGGFSDGTFKGNNPLSRAEFVKILYAILKPQDEGFKAAFSDIGGHWAEKEISALSRLGVLKGYEDGKFYPEREVTRAEFVVVINRIVKLHTEVKENPFADVKKYHWAYEDIMKAAIS